MGNKMHIGVIAAGLLLAPIAALAQTVAKVGDLDAIQSERIVMQARAALEVERENYQKARAVNGDTDGTLPVLKSIMGRVDRQIVTFIYPGNVKVSARPQESIPGGFTVGRIDDDAGQVELIRGKEKYKVGFSTVVPVSKQKQPTTQQIGGQFPVVPPIQLGQ